MELLLGVVHSIPWEGGGGFHSFDDLAVERAAELEVLLGIIEGGECDGACYSPRTISRLLKRNGFIVPFGFTTLPRSPTWRQACEPQVCCGHPIQPCGPR